MVIKVSTNCQNTCCWLQNSPTTQGGIKLWLGGYRQIVNFLADLSAGGILLPGEVGAPPAGVGPTGRAFCNCAGRTMVEEFLQSERQKKSSLLFRSLEDSTVLEALNQMDCHPKQKLQLIGIHLLSSTRPGETIYC